MEHTPENPPSLAPNLYWFCGVVFVVLVFYGRTAQFEFAGIDDDANLLGNPLVTGALGLAEAWVRPFLHLYIPVSYSFWRGLALVLGGIKPAGFHLANAALHGLNAGVVFLLLRRWQPALTRAAAALGALGFALHPMQVEAVAWVSSARDLLATFWSLIALLIYVYPDHKQRRFTLAFATVAFCLALLSKPTAVVTPLIAAALIPRRLWQRPYLDTILLWCSIALAAAVLSAHLQPAVENPFVVSWYERPALVLAALGFYVQKLAWPIGLSADYGLTPVKLMRSVPYLATGTVFAIAALRSVGLRLFVIGLLPTLGFVPFFYQAISAVADRYAYFAMLGPGLLMAIWWRRGPQLHWALTATVIIWASLSALQMDHWASRIAISRRMVATNPASWFGYFNWGSALLEKGDGEAARHYLEASIRLRPWFPDSHYNLALADVASGDLGGAEEHLRANLHFGGENASALIWLGHVLALQGKYDDADPFFRRGLSLDPAHAGGRLHFARMLRSRGHNDEALQQLDQVGPAGLTDRQYHILRGELLLARGEPVKAIEAYEQALVLGAHDALTYANLGVAYLRTRDYLRAEEVLQKAIARDPYKPEALHSMGLVYEATDRPDEAIAVWTTASGQGFQPAIAALRRIRLAKPKGKELRR